MYSDVTTSHRNFPARASLLILSTKDAPPRRRYLTLMPGYLFSKLLSMLPTIAPPVSVPYQTTSPSFFACSIDGELCCAPAGFARAREMTSDGTIIMRRRYAMKSSLPRRWGICSVLVGYPIASISAGCKRLISAVLEVCSNVDSRYGQGLCRSKCSSTEVIDHETSRKRR